MSVLLHLLAALLAAPSLALGGPSLVFVVVLALALAAHATLNITLEDTASQIIYSPAACGLTLPSAGAGPCSSSWCVPPPIILPPRPTSEISLPPSPHPSLPLSLCLSGGRNLGRLSLRPTPQMGR